MSFQRSKEQYDVTLEIKGTDSPHPSRSHIIVGTKTERCEAGTAGQAEDIAANNEVVGIIHIGAAKRT